MFTDTHSGPDTDPAQADPGSARALPWSVGLAGQINRRRFLRQTADATFFGVAGLVAGQTTFGSFARSLSRKACSSRTNCCEPTTGHCCPRCCGPSPACSSSCCSQNCCRLGTNTCNSSCGFKGDWSGHSCWSKSRSSGNCTILTVCCDCNSRCSAAGKPNTCICYSILKTCRDEKGWSRWDPVLRRWIPAGEDPFALVA
jgi:hypothetical protein